MGLPIRRLGNRRTIHIKKLMIIEAGTFDDQFRRPYTSLVTPDSLNVLKNAVSNGRNIEAGTISGVISDIIFPTAAPEVNPSGRYSVIDIENGWREPRYRFLMIVEINDGIISKTELLQGWSEGANHSLQGTLDPNLQYRINSVATLKGFQYETPTGLVDGMNLVNASHVLSHEKYGGLDRDGFSGHNLFQMTPNDVLGMMSLEHANEFVDNNLIGMLNSQPVLANRTNNLPATYAERVFSGMYKAKLVDSANLEAMEEGDFSINNGQSEVTGSLYSRAKAHVQEALLSDNSIIDALTRDIDLSQGGVFSLDMLRKIDPNLDKVIMFMTVTPAARADLPCAGTGETWNGSDSTTHVASILSSAIPTLMIEAGLMRVGFMVTNRTMTGLVDIFCSIAPVPVAEGMDTQRPFEIFKINLIQKCINSISMGGDRDFQINVTANLIGDSRYEIALDGDNNFVPYVQPTFCDSLLSPIVSSNRDSGLRLARDFNGLVNEAVFPLVTNAPSGHARQSIQNSYAQPAGRRDYGF